MIRVYRYIKQQHQHRNDNSVGSTVQKGHKRLINIFHTNRMFNQVSQLIHPAYDILRALTV